MARNRSLPSQLDVFQKILILEGSKNYSNSAVIGGLDRFLDGIRTELTALAIEHPDLLSSS